MMFLEREKTLGYKIKYQKYITVSKIKSLIIL